MSDARRTPEEDRLGMTEEQWERFQAYTHGFGEQDENGVDVSLLRENLKLTPEQRVRRMFAWMAAERGVRLDEVEFQFAQLVQALQGQEVRFLVIGGLAMNAHGSDYHTRDIDVYYARDRENLEALARAVAPLHPRLRGAEEGLPFQWDARTLAAGLNFTLITDLGAVDFLGEVPGAASFADLWKRSVETELFGATVRVVSLDDLVSMKRAAGRDKDKDHLRELERLRAVQHERET
jgi:predicted nucleotidyltransferase